MDIGSAVGPLALLGLIAYAAYEVTKKFQKRRQGPDHQQSRRNESHDRIADRASKAPLAAPFPALAQRASPKIFLSYRREDSPDATGRIYDRLVQQFGEGAVFKDVDSMPIGVDYRKFLDQAISGATAVLVIVGPKWLSASGPKGVMRLASTTDFVRIEVASALRREIPVIPLLVSGATMPDPEALPEEIRELTYRHAVAVRPDPDFSNDMERLIRGLTKLHAPSPDSNGDEV